jgi:hypothetical protein
MNYGSKEWRLKHFTVKSVVHKTALSHKMINLQLLRLLYYIHGSTKD